MVRGELVSQEYIVQLTGRKQAKKQSKVLKAKHIRHIINAQNKVQIDVSWLGSGEQAPEPVQPDFSGIT